MVLEQVSGPSGQMTWIRDGPKCLDARNITEAIDNRSVHAPSKTIVRMLKNISGK